MAGVAGRWRHVAFLLASECPATGSQASPFAGVWARIGHEGDAAQTGAAPGRLAVYRPFAGIDAPEVGTLPARLTAIATCFTAQEHVGTERAARCGARASKSQSCIHPMQLDSRDHREVVGRRNRCRGSTYLAAFEVRADGRTVNATADGRTAHLAPFSGGSAPPATRSLRLGQGAGRPESASSERASEQPRSSSYGASAEDPPMTSRRCRAIVPWTEVAVSCRF